ncbi:RepA [Digitaria didactyla striate mosaic virus]|uniref:Replication-associated protein n=1 Tax=Digitaria didactyla striate mosaic virus TaxID=889510 RepID=E2FER4_9GEMI|nr:RepA [Digitaria didactyla striate mosaic virus]ADN93259.1 RepA [Digitaria didactyla striate mosaic virus]
MSSQLVSDSVMFDPRSYGEYPSSESAASLPLSFNVRSQHVFLTYPRCPIPPKDAGSFLKKLCKRYNIQYMYIAQELHQDGEPHLHAFLQFDKVFRTTSAKYFDFFEFHPNIQAARNPEKTLEYCQKNPADFYEDGVFVKPKASRKRKLASFTRDKKMKQIMANATSRDEYLSMIRKAFPFDWAIRLQQFEYSAKALFPEAPIQYQPQFVSNDMSDHPVIGEWLDTEFFTVSVSAYSVHALVSEEQAKLDLQWMSDVTRNEVRIIEDDPYISVDQQELERLLGPEVLELTTTGNTL